MAASTVLVIGGTGAVGKKVVAVLKERGVAVRAMVRPSSSAAAIEGPGVTIVRGDMLDPPSLDLAFAGVDVVISCAAGYMGRKQGDTAKIDQVGNANLAAAAKRSGVKRYVLCSILKCDQGMHIPHFRDKVQAENELRRLGVPFVSLRPGAFLDQSPDFMADNARKNKFMGFGGAESRYTWIYTQDLARSLVEAALTEKDVAGKCIDVGWSTGPVSAPELGTAIAAATHRKLKMTLLPWWLVLNALWVVGLVKPLAADFGKMFAFLAGGKSVADTKLHDELLGPSPTMADAVKRWAEAEKLVV